MSTKFWAVEHKKKRGESIFSCLWKIHMLLFSPMNFSAFCVSKLNSFLVSILLFLYYNSRKKKKKEKCEYDISREGDLPSRVKYGPDKWSIRWT